MASLAACAVLNADESQVKERRRQTDPRAARLGIVRSRKRKRGKTHKEIAFTEWLEQAVTGSSDRPDIALVTTDPEVIDLTGEVDRE